MSPEHHALFDLLFHLNGRVNFALGMVLGFLWGLWVATAFTVWMAHV